jgi:hypothetical protein
MTLRPRRDDQTRPACPTCDAELQPHCRTCNDTWICLLCDCYGRQLHGQWRWLPRQHLPNQPPPPKET